MFAIVEFSDSVEIIPVKWFNTEEEEECFWPELFPFSKISKLVSQQTDPNPGWRKYSVRSLGKAATYERAREKLKLSEISSDLNLTENENTEKATGVLKRKRVSMQCFQFDSDSEEYSDVLQKQILKSQTAKSHTKSSIAKKGALSTSILLPPPQIVHRQLPVSNDSNSQDISFQIVPSKKTLPKNTSSYSFSSSPLPERPSQLREQSSFSTPTSSSDHNIVAKSDSTMSLLKEIIKCQQEIKINQENHSVILNSLLRNHNINCQTTQLPDEITLLLPLQGLGAVEEFEVKLRDSDIFKAMVLYLSDQGGRSLVEAIGRMMEKLISNELARSCNLSGRNGKKGLKGSLLLLILTSYKEECSYIKNECERRRNWFVQWAYRLT